MKIALKNTLCTFVDLKVYVDAKVYLCHIIYIKVDEEAKAMIKATIQEKGFELTANKNTKGDTIRVFMYLCYEMDSSGWIDIPQVQIAENMAISDDQVSRAVIDLVSKGAISKLRHDGKGKTLIKVTNSFANKDFEWLVREDEVDWTKYEGNK